MISTKAWECPHVFLHHAASVPLMATSPSYHFYTSLAFYLMKSIPVWPWELSHKPSSRQGAVQLPDSLGGPLVGPQSFLAMTQRLIPLDHCHSPSGAAWRSGKQLTYRIKIAFYSQSVGFCLEKSLLAEGQTVELKETNTLKYCCTRQPLSNITGH